MLSLGLLGALWASSSGVTAIMEALNVVYGATETRPYWKVRVLASLLTVGLAGFIILSITLILYGRTSVNGSPIWSAWVGCFSSAGTCCSGPWPSC